MSTIYDRIVYPNAPFPLTQPSRLAVPAALFGLDYPPPETARVLEIACGDGANLIPTAAAYPEAEFFGFDLAADCVAKGRDLIAALGLTNIRLEALDLMETGDIGEFDYVVAHGLYAWVPEPVRDGVMALISRVLSPHGIAFVSYNTLPGCRPRQAMRDLVLTRLEGIDDLDARMAETTRFLKLLAETYTDEENPFHRAMRDQTRRLLERPIEVTFHDELGEAYAPLLFRDFAAHAAAHGLQFLSEAEPHRVEPKSPKGPGVPELMAEAQGDVIRTEQYVDLLNLESFRQSLLCRADRTIERRIDPARLRTLHMAANLQAQEDGRFKGPTCSSLQVSDLARPVVEAMVEAWPGTIPLSDVDERIYAELLKLHFFQVAELSAAPRATVRSGERPRAWPVARAQLQAGVTMLTTQLHTQLEVTDPAGLHFISLLDGDRTRPEIASAMAEKVGAPPEAVAASMEQHLARLSRAALLDA